MYFTLQERVMNEMIVKKKIKNGIGRFLTYFFLLILVLFVLFPVAWMVSTSFKPAAEIFTIPPKWVPLNPTIKNYEKVLVGSNVPKYFVNSVIVGIITTFLSLAIGCSAGYGLSRYQFKGNRSISLFMLLSQMLPITVLMTPIYLLMLKLGLIDSIIGLSLSHLILTLPLVTWMSKGYFDSIPKELEEAALIDGCSQIRALIKITLPLAAPGIAATAIYAFIMSWNEYVLASIITMSEKSKTLPIGLSEFSTMFYVDWGSTMAAAVLISIPVIVFFLWLQRYFIQGLSQGAVKG